MSQPTAFTVQASLACMVVAVKFTGQPKSDLDCMCSSARMAPKGFSWLGGERRCFLCSQYLLQLRIASLHLLRNLKAAHGFACVDIITALLTRPKSSESSVMRDGI